MGVVLALDPGLTTGWALLTEDWILIGCGNLKPEDVDVALDHIIRRCHRNGHCVEAIVEQMPPGPNGRLSIDLAFVKRTIDDKLSTFEVEPCRVTPGTWKTSRAAVKAKALLPEAWDGMPLTQHQKDAILMACFYLDPGPALREQKAAIARRKETKWMLEKPGL